MILLLDKRPLMMLMMMIMVLMTRETEANMGATRLVRFERKQDSIYRAVSF